MTDREKQIEKIQNLLPDVEVIMATRGYIDFPRYLYDHNCRIITEDSVVLTKGAYESISSKAKANVVNAVEIRKETTREILKLTKEKCKELEDKYSHYCKSKKECLEETCRYEGVLAVKRELYELAKQNGVDLEE